jgi:predicted nucleotidyltransferase component of viral defense system
MFSVDIKFRVGDREVLLERFCDVVPHGAYSGLRKTR